MKKIHLVGMILVFLLLTSAASAAPPAPLDPALERALRAAEESDGDLRVIVYLREPAPTAASVTALQAHAARTQAPLRAYLDAAQAAGQVAAYTPFWIFDGLAVQARPETVRALAARPDVAAVRLDRYRRWVETFAAASDPAAWGVPRIRADQVWASLNISGTGAVVAGMDTGVDWLHPALQTAYRGYNPHGPANHLFNWYDATSMGSAYPVDGHGHGTHTLGTILGSDGIGVAPGARWIGVRVLDSAGYGYDSWIHAGFQWLLAPGGDPAMAPDVVNCSWGNHNGALTTFQSDLRALRAAGINVIFAAGNDGPSASSVNSPAALPEAFAVGASDQDEEVANFSSRGPSPWGEIRPHVVAPGVDVYSSLPGGVYGSWSGTSMAAPHVSGLVALMRSVSPTVSITRAAYLITSTAVPLGDPVPNNDAGWGRVDALAAVAALVHHGYLSGTVMRADDGRPVADATVQALRQNSTDIGHAATSADGHYLLILAPGDYDLTVSAFGYQTATLWAVPVTTDTTTVRNIPLTPLPSGRLRVHPSDGATGETATATVSVL
ncbi:MAG TPA: hypothetical protein ENK17_06775, partial [Anaerolineae bacterium]|nr:hypothetical protein [Anaerolineae bacterium]